MTITNARQTTRAFQPHDGGENESLSTSAIFPKPGNGGSSGGLVPPDDTLRANTVPLHLEWFDGRTRTVQIVVIDLNEWTERICLDGNTIGFINRVGLIFVAETGNRADRAEECGQFRVWDSAVAILVSMMGHIPEPEQPGKRVRVQNQITALSDSGAGQPSCRQNIHEKMIVARGDKKW